MDIKNTKNQKSGDGSKRWQLIHNTSAIKKFMPMKIDRSIFFDYFSFTLVRLFLFSAPNPIYILAKNCRVRICRRGKCLQLANT